MNMDRWVLFGKSGNPSYEVSKSWFKNHGIPREDRSIYSITREEIERISKLVSGGAKSLVYPNAFSYTLINPQRTSEQGLVEEIQKGLLSEEEVISRLAQHPYLIITPIITNMEKVIIGYQYETMVSTFRSVKVKDVLV